MTKANPFSQQILNLKNSRTISNNCARLIHPRLRHITGTFSCRPGGSSLYVTPTPEDTPEVKDVGPPGALLSPISWCELTVCDEMGPLWLESRSDDSLERENEKRKEHRKNVFRDKADYAKNIKWTNTLTKNRQSNLAGFIFPNDKNWTIIRILLISELRSLPGINVVVFPFFRG